MVKQLVLLHKWSRDVFTSHSGGGLLGRLGGSARGGGARAGAGAALEPGGTSGRGRGRRRRSGGRRRRGCSRGRRGSRGGRLLGGTHDLCRRPHVALNRCRTVEADLIRRVDVIVQVLSS